MDDSDLTEQKTHHTELKASPDAALQFEPGSLIAHQYQVESKLGGGGMSVVYRCRDVALGRLVAIKVLQAHLANTDKGIVRLQQEARVLSKVKHPNIVTIYHLVAGGDGPPYLVMDYLEGRSLSDLIAHAGSLELKRSLGIMRQVADALAHAHDLGIVHRDLKPSNIMLVSGECGPETVKILDFGIAKILHPDQQAANITQTGEIFGSPTYMSPEQSMGKVVDARSDQYSFGCVLYECLTGTPPHVASTAMGTLMKHVTEEALPMEQASLGKKFPEQLESCVLRMLSKEKEQRFPSMRDVYEALSDVERPHPKPAAKAAPAHTGLQSASNRGLLAAVVLSIAGLCWLCMLAIGRMDQPNSAESSWQPVLVPADQKLKNYSDEDDADDRLSVAVRSNLYATKFSGSSKYTFLTNKSLEKIGQLRSLEELDLIGCQGFTDDGLRSLRNCTKLKSIALDKTAITDRAMAIVSSMSRLQDLRVRRTNITNKGLAYLQALPALARLDLSRTKVNDLSSLGKIKTLNTLVLNHLHVNSSLPTLQGLPLLTHLRLYEGHIKDSELPLIAKLGRLTTLDLSRTDITDQGLETISQLTKLQELTIRECNGITQEAIDKFKHQLPQCQVITTGVPDEE